MKVVAVVVTFNGMKWIDRCLLSLRAGIKPVQVVVIDNLSADGTPDHIKLNFPEVTLIKAGANLGFGRANNIGLKKALSENVDYVFLLNQDAWIDTGCIDKLIDVHARDQSYGILSPLHISGDNASLEFKFIEYIQPNVCQGLISDYFMNIVKPVYETTFVNAAAWLISKDCLTTVGGFDPLFAHYGEDVDYAQRAQNFKFKIGISPLAKIWHDSKIQTWEEIKWNKKRMMMIYFYEVKTVAGSLRSNTLIFLKKRFDDFTGHILFRRFKMLYFQIKLTANLLFSLPKISKSRKASVNKCAFLSDL